MYHHSTMSQQPNSCFPDRNCIFEPSAVTLSAYKWGHTNLQELQEHGNIIRHTQNEWPTLWRNVVDKMLTEKDRSREIKECFGIAPSDHEHWELSLHYIPTTTLFIKNKYSGDTRHENGSYMETGDSNFPRDVKPPPLPDLSKYTPLHLLYSQQQINQWVSNGTIHEKIDDWKKWSENNGR